MSGAALAHVADRLAKLLPMLASPHAGEVAATAAAIGRTLTAAGLDWHSLAKAITAPGASPPPDPAPSWQPPKFTFSNLGPGDARRTIARMLETGPVNDWERDFCTSIAEDLRVRPYRLPTPAQVKVLDGIWRKTVGAR